MEHQLINSKATHYSGIVYSDHSFEPHFHNSYELIYAMKGRIGITVGREIVNLSEGELILIAPCVVHEITDDEKATFFIAIITPNYITDFFEAHQNDLAIRFHIDAEAADFIRQHLIREPLPTAYQIKACFYLLLSFAENGTVVLSAKDNSISFVYTVNSYIADHFTGKLQRKDLAQLLGYEEHYFSTLFYKNFGMGFRAYLNQCRLSSACQLLQTTKSSVSSIAFDSGFSSVREFNNVFSRLMGTTPTEYRKSHAASRQSD